MNEQQMVEAVKKIYGEHLVPCPKSELVNGKCAHANSENWNCFDCPAKSLVSLIRQETLKEVGEIIEDIKHKHYETHDGDMFFRADILCLNDSLLSGKMPNQEEVK